MKYLLMLLFLVGCTEAKKEKTPKTEITVGDCFYSRSRDSWAKVYAITKYKYNTDIQYNVANLDADKNEFYIQIKQRIDIDFKERYSPLSTCIEYDVALEKATNLTKFRDLTIRIQNLENKHEKK